MDFEEKTTIMSRGSYQLLSRRGFLRKGILHRLTQVLGLVSAAGVISACKTRKRDDIKKDSLDDSGKNASKESEDTKEVAGSGATGKQNPELDDPTKSEVDGGSPETCDQSQVNFIPWEKLPDVQENLIPVYKFYGDTASSMMVVSLPFYQHGNLLEIFLVRPSGKLLAGKGITDPADIRPNTTLRPVVFDNLQIKSDRHLVILFKTACRTCEDGFLYSKHEMQYSITFSDTFMGKKVHGLTPRSRPGVYSDYQAYANISPDEESTAGFFDSGTYTVASEDAVFLGTNYLKDYQITDLAGNLISNTGEKFNNIVEYPEFICYRLVDNQFYIRTFVRLV